MARPKLRRHRYKVGAPRRFGDEGDYSLPGYNYLGPGNNLDKGPPTNANDAVALRHDIKYGHIMDGGEEPYWNWNDADEEALREFTFDDYGGAAGKAYFGTKKLAYNAGFIGKVGDKRKAIDQGATEDQAVKKKERVWDPNTTALSNFRSSANMNGGGDGEGQAARQGIRETPVDHVRNVSLGIDEYTFAALPYMETVGITTPNNQWNVDHTYRMTSPYDPRVTTFTEDLNAGTGVTLSNRGTTDPDVTIINANWWQYYADQYNYYHVVECRYSLYLENKGSKDIWAHLMFYNDESPPAAATNDDIMTWKGVRTQYLKSPFNAVTSAGRVETLEFNYDTDVNLISEEGDGTVVGQNNYEANNHVVSRSGHVSCNFSGSYQPGDYNREIRLDEQVQNWTPVTSNPALPERLLLRIKPTTEGFAANNAFNYGDQLSYKLMVKLTYVVEFKELKIGLRWPVQRNPARVTITADAETSIN